MSMLTSTHRRFGDIPASFLCVSVAVLCVPDTDQPERQHQTACRSPCLCVALGCFFIQCFTSSYLIKDAFRVRLFSKPFFPGLASASLLGETGCSVNTATNAKLIALLRMSASCTCVSAAVLCVPGTAVHRLSVWATQDRNVITALLRLQRLPAKTADGLAKTIKNTCIIFCDQSLSRNA
jgi:hypothetical protein